METKGVLAACEPRLVWTYFEQLCSIPHPSGHEERVADWICAFAREKNLYCYRDGVGNVFLRRPAAPGCEDGETLMFQGHMDMVPEKDPDKTHDFLRDGLTLSVRDGWICADGTTLGGDDGVSVAMMMAILDCPPAEHPAIECLFTVGEEVGLDGMRAFDPVAAGMTAKTVINLDSEEEGIITMGCAGGMRTDLTLPLSRTEETGYVLSLDLSGLSGGHSGAQIHEGHVNAIKSLGELLLPLLNTYDLRLISVSGGGKDNVIAPAARAACLLITDSRETAAACRDALSAKVAAFRAQPSVLPVDRDFVCTVSVSDERGTRVCADGESTRRVFSMLTLAKSGVLAMHAQVGGLVAYSRNAGVLTTDEDKVVLSFSTRSANEYQLDAAATELEALARVLGGSASHRGRYPGWEYKADSVLAERFSAIASDELGIPYTRNVIHAGLECGLLCGKCPGIDVISVGPDMKDIHTPREMLSIPSTERIYRVLSRVIQSYAHGKKEK